jgi:hypothetical protein
MLDLVSGSQPELSCIGDKTAAFLSQIETLRASGIKQWSFVTDASLL